MVNTIAVASCSVSKSDANVEGECRYRDETVDQHAPGVAEEYVFAIAEAMRHEYEAIVAAGATVQLDCPDIAMGRHTTYAELDLAGYRKKVAMNIEALNHAVRNIPAERVRMHLCWGNYPGPHHCDVALAEIIDLVWKAKPQTILFEAANPRHAHE